MFKKKLLLITVLFCFLFTGRAYTENSLSVTGQKDIPLAIAIFTNNNTNNPNYDKYGDMLCSAIASQITGKFTVINKNDVINVFRQENIKSSFKISNFRDYLQLLSVLKQEENKSNKEDTVDKKTIEQKASALRISQAIGAKYLLIADIEDIVVNNITDTVYNNQINDLKITADIAVKILNGVNAGTILAENIRVQKRVHGNQQSNFTFADIEQSLPILINQASKDISVKILDNIDTVKTSKADIESVRFNVKTNVSDATVELDGILIETVDGEFFAMPGLHRLRVTRDGYRTFERDINVIANAEFIVNLKEIEKPLDIQEQNTKLESKVSEKQK